MKGSKQEKPKKSLMPFLESIFGDAKDTNDKVARIAGNLEQDGEEFEAAEQTATMTKAEKLTKVWRIKSELKNDTALSEALKDHLRTRIMSPGKEVSEKTLGKNERQDLVPLVLRGCFKLKRTTAWRYTKLFYFLESLTDVDPALWGQRILHEGGILQCLAAADKKKVGESGPDGAASLMTNKEFVEGSDDGLDESDEAQDDHEPLPVIISRGSADYMVDLPHGRYLFPTLWQVDDRGLAVASVTPDHRVTDPMFEALPQSEDVEWHGLQPPAGRRFKFSNAPDRRRRGESGEAHEGDQPSAN